MTEETIWRKVAGVYFICHECRTKRHEQCLNRGTKTRSWCDCQCREKPS